MDKEKFDALEVKPKAAGWYFVTIYQFEKMESHHPDYIKDWLMYNGEDWEYGGYEGNCYVCFIHKKEGL